MVLDTLEEIFGKAHNQQTADSDDDGHGDTCRGVCVAEESVTIGILETFEMLYHGAVFTQTNFAPIKVHGLFVEEEHDFSWLLFSWATKMRDGFKC